MRRKFTFNYSWIAIVTSVIFMNFAFTKGFGFSTTDTTYLHFLKSKSKTPLKPGLHLVLPPIKPAVISTTKVSVYKPDDKLLNNVQVYPNPVTADKNINVKYDLSRPSNVSIKIVDVLGNDIVTLFSQRVEPGEKTFNYYLNNKLNRGFYFVRVIAAGVCY